MALMEGGVDLAAIMARSGLLSAEIGSHETGQKQSGSERGREQRPAAREAGSGSVQQRSSPVGAAANGMSGAGSRNGAVSGTVTVSAASIAAAIDRRRATIGANNGAVTVPASAANGAAASNGATPSAAPAPYDSRRSGNGSSGSQTLNGAAAASSPAVTASGSPSVDQSSSVSLDDSSSRSDHNVEVGVLRSLCLHSTPCLHPSCRGSHEAVVPLQSTAPTCLVRGHQGSDAMLGCRPPYVSLPCQPLPLYVGDRYLFGLQYGDQW